MKATPNSNDFRTFRISRLLGMLALLLFCQTAVKAADNNTLPAKIQDGVILHCFEWKFKDIEAELPAIAEAGFNTIQTSPAQPNRNYRTIWYDVYRPWGFTIGTTILGSKDDLKSLCTEAHKYGIKIIVDVVANHTVSFNGNEISNLPAYWQDTKHYHTEGGVWDYSNREAVTHGNIGMYDIRTEDADNQQEIRKYVQELKSVGVDGIRWDAAKHIGVPSEGDNFWPVVLDADMFNYGEILGSTGGDASKIFPEYLSMMSITDSQYGTNQVLGALKQGNVPSNGSNLANRYNTTKLVYWGESHDTFCNSGDQSVGVDQNVVDRAYAIAASHNGIPALYFSRPNGGSQAGLSAQMGDKGSLHFKDKEVAEVNKFHNALAGQPEQYAIRNGVASSCREGGAIIVKGSGSGEVTATNAGSITTPGTYVDMVSGNTFTVTDTEISGTIGEKGIAVIYADSKPRVMLSPNGGSFTTETLSVTATTNNATKAWIAIDGGEETAFTGTTTVTIGKGASYGSKITITWRATDSEGNENSGTATYTKKDPAEGTKVYYNNANNWNDVSCYVYYNDGEITNGSWPGEAMRAATNLTINGISGTWYVYDVPENLAYGQVIVSNNGSNQYPNGAGLELEGKSKVLIGETWLDVETVTTTISLPTAGSTTDRLTGAAIYTIHGQRVGTAGYSSSLPKGIYIVNRKKVVID